MEPSCDIRTEFISNGGNRGSRMYGRQLVKMKRSSSLKFHLPHLLFLLLLLLPWSFAGDVDECRELSVSSDCASYAFGDQQWIQSGPVSCSANCEQWIITRRQGEVITLSFEYLDVPDRDTVNCKDSYLLIGPQNCRRLCGVYTNGTAISFIAKSDVRILYRRSNMFGLGFKLRYTIGSVPSKKPCLQTEFTCGNGKCIPSVWRCNNAYECEDQSDEVCSDVRPVHTTVSTPLDYSCGLGGFCCVDRIYGQRHCFPDSSRCDNVVDCLDRGDERDCSCEVTLSGLSGFISYPAGSSYGLDCEFLVTIPNGTVQLRFKDFSFSGSDDDYLEIYHGGVADEVRLIGRFSGKHKPSRILESNADQIYMKYHRSSISSNPFFNCSYQKKGHCMLDQFSCVYEEDCFDLSSACDDQWDCKRFGKDELNCGSCIGESYRCHTGSICYLYNGRCNGIPDCNNYADELQCSQEQCGHHNGTFLCHNGQCIIEHLVCNGYYNCKDNSDEQNCPLPSKIVIAAVIGSLCCGLLLVIAAGAVCRLQAVRALMNPRSRHISPITAIQEELLARLSAPPLYDEAMITSRPYDEVRSEMLRRMQLPELLQEPGTSIAPFGAETIRPLILDGGGSAADVLVMVQPEVEDDDDDDALIDVGECNMGASASDSDLDCSSTFNDSLVDLSLATGLHAQWRRSHLNENPASLAEINETNADLCLNEICDTVQLITSNTESLLGDSEPKPGEIDRI